MMEDPRNITFCAHLLFCSKNIERIGDHATNIAETVVYLVTGSTLPTDRPRGRQGGHRSRRDGSDQVNQARKDIRPGAASAPRILIVKDESDLSLLLGYNLEAEGYVVENVERGDEAELQLAENAPDLVILDWMLPGVSGLEICRRLRARESTRTLPVIMVTARGEEAERVRGPWVRDRRLRGQALFGARAHGAGARIAQAQPSRADRRAFLCRGDLDLDRETRRVRRGVRKNIVRSRPSLGCSNISWRSRGRVFSRAQLFR